MTDSGWLVFLILVAADLIISAARASLVNAHLPQLLNLKEHHPGATERAEAIISKPRARVSLRLAITWMHFALAVVGWLALQPWIGRPLTPAEAVAILVAAGLLVLLLEHAVEGDVLRGPEEWVIRTATISGLVDLVLSPVSSLFLAVLHSSGAAPMAANPVTEDELKTWVEEGQPEGSLERGERQMIASIFQFRDTLAREIMVPRIEIQALDVGITLKEAVDIMSQSGHSRVPVYEENIDNIIGFLYAKDLLRVKSVDGETLATRRKLLRPAYFVPETKKADELLTEMQARRVHIAVVVDEYGGVAGLVTLEDIVEEIVGEIQDEYDQAEEVLAQKVGPDEYIFLGRISLDDFNEIMDSQLVADGADTLAGFIYGAIGRIPAGGENLQVDGLLLTVEQVSGRRIRKVRARRNQPSPQAEVENANAD